VPVAELLAAAEVVAASELTLAESRRALVRATALGKRTPEETERYERKLVQASAAWAHLPVDDAALDRAGRSFPVEPLRTLDAIHLASALLARSAVPDLALLSLDDRVRANGRALGFALLPEEVG
jgi:predicted nucleic acid-binding protein